MHVTTGHFFPDVFNAHLAICKLHAGMKMAVLPHAPLILWIEADEQIYVCHRNSSSVHANDLTMSK